MHDGLGQMNAVYARKAAEHNYALGLGPHPDTMDLPEVPDAYALGGPGSGPQKGGGSVKAEQGKLKEVMDKVYNNGAALKMLSVKERNAISRLRDKEGSKERLSKEDADLLGSIHSKLKGVKSQLDY